MFYAYVNSFDWINESINLRFIEIKRAIFQNFEDFVMKANTVDACRLAIAAQKLRPEKVIFIDK